MAQIVLEDLPLHEREEFLAKISWDTEERKRLVADLQKNCNRYRITQNAKLIVLGQPITHTITKTEWGISYKINNGIEAEVSVLKEEQELDGGWKELFSLMKKLTSPLQKIIFKLSLKGYILEVANRGEILERWNTVKTEFIDDESFSDIIQLGDKDYLDPLQSIRKNIIYQLFFFSLYKPDFRSGQSVNTIGKDVFLQSVIFPECNFKTDVEEKIYERNRGYSFYNQYTINQKIDRGQIKSLYKKKYKQFMIQNTGSDNEISDYFISYDSKYKILEETGTLIHSKTVFQENVNDNLYYKSDIEIELINK